MVSKNKLCPYSPKGLYGQKNYKDSLSLSPEQTFIKLNSSLSLSLSPDHFEFVKTLVFSDSSDTPNF